MDSAGDFFTTSFTTGKLPADDVVELSPGGIEVRSFAVTGAIAVAVGASGDVYAASRRVGSRDRIVVYDKDGNKLIPTGEEEAEAAQRESEGRKGERFGETGASLTGLATGSGCEIPGEDLYVFNGGAFTALRAYGPAPQDPGCPPPAVPPSIHDQYAASVGMNAATLRAKINPHFWQNTTYYVEYGTGKCSEGGCTSQQPLPPGSNLTEEVTSAQLLGTVNLSGLTPKTTYHYRFVAQSGGGGPVRGVGGNLVTDGQEASFTTLSFPPPLDCPNEEFRVGASAGLADCRAYEMVSPIDKNNGDILALEAEDGRAAALDQSSLDGGKVTYSSYRSFGDAQSAPLTTAYMATRGENGWTSQAISPPGGATVIEPIHAVNNQFKAFSPDLCTSWLREESGQVLANGAIPGYANLYRRQNCGSAAGSYTALTVPSASLHREPKFFVPEFQGVSSDGSAMVFRVSDSLVPGAPDPGLGKPMVYEASGEIELHLVCVLPNGTPWTAGCSVGTGGFPYGRGESAYHAISTDGSRVYWSAAREGSGKLYLRENSAQPPSEIVSGNCVQPELACTALISSNESAQFWGATTDGSKAFYTTGELGVDQGQGKATLFEFNAETRTSNQIAAKVDGVLGMSDDGSRLYLISEEELDTGAAAGQPNLYLYEAGQFTFIGQLSRSDAGGRSATLMTPVHVEPRFHVAQVTPSGDDLVFMSNSPALSEATAQYNNTDQNSGEADLEVYLYNAPSNSLRCVSCNPTNARPVGANIALFTDEKKQWAAARIPTSESGAFLMPRIISP
ncbi:MAG TPA: hypothetical protein VNN15_01480, partial [Solirubrobacterales bacterium]|nr:hypothetical protein [Solirubrobacterales bacterium]